jgi:SAM-dependent methyltransferase
MSRTFDEHEGRALFGANPDSYDAVRPPYPEAIYDLLQETGALRPGVATLEIGAGSGLATRRLLELGAAPLTALEPDQRFGPLLHAIGTAHAAPLQLVHASFEEAELPEAGYDLAVAATSFHWLRPATRVAKLARLIRPGGHLALWWNVFGDPELPDAFHEATKHILGPLAPSPSEGRGGLPFALDRAARRAELMAGGAFEEPRYAVYHWPLRLSSAQVGALFATFSNISRLPAERRDAILAELVAIAERDFGGVVRKQMVSPIYIARRQASGVRRQETLGLIL